MTENRPKIILRNTFSVKEKSPPPTKLLINHGKPNFTIKKSPKSHPNDNKTKFDINQDKMDSVNNNVILDRAKANLKNSTVCKTPENKEQNEFFETYKKISERVSRENSYNSENGDYKTKSTSPIPPESPKIENSPINSVATLESGHETLNGGSKPVALEKPTNIKLLKPKLPPKPLESPPLPETPTMQNNNANFEHKTVVSFSKDLYTEPNKYPDTVKVSKTLEAEIVEKEILEELSKIKFDIDSDGKVITHVMRD